MRTIQIIFGRRAPSQSAEMSSVDTAEDDEAYAVAQNGAKRNYRFGSRDRLQPNVSSMSEAGGKCCTGLIVNHLVIDNAGFRRC